MLKKPYLYINTSCRSNYESLLMDATVLPSQYMRQVIAKAVGKPDEWDWNVYLGEKELVNCLAKLKPLFVQLEKEYGENKEANQNRKHFKASQLVLL